MKCLLGLIWFAALLPAQIGPVWNFAALSYGPHRWSTIKITNPGGSPISVGAEAYDQSGKPIPVPDSFELKAAEAREIRIEKSTTKNEFAWARVAIFQGRKTSLKVEAWTEEVQGNTITRSPQQEVPISTLDSWYASPGRNRFIYFANVGDRDLDLTVCWSSNPRKNVCDIGESAKHASHISIQPKRALLARLGEPRGKFLIVVQWWTSSGFLPVLATFLGPGTTEQRHFSTDSALDFEGLESGDAR